MYHKIMLYLVGDRSLSLSYLFIKKTKLSGETIIQDGMKSSTKLRETERQVWFLKKGVS